MSKTNTNNQADTGAHTKGELARMLHRFCKSTANPYQVNSPLLHTTMSNAGSGSIQSVFCGTGQFAGSAIAWPCSSPQFSGSIADCLNNGIASAPVVECIDKLSPLNTNRTSVHQEQSSAFCCYLKALLLAEPIFASKFTAYDLDSFESVIQEKGEIEFASDCSEQFENATFILGLRGILSSFLGAHSIDDLDERLIFVACKIYFIHLEESIYALLNATFEADANGPVNVKFCGTMITPRELARRYAFMRLLDGSSSVVL